ncbi:MAG: hypothetical protein LC734_11225, partial [Acidobacteria bacterium]|nr:hypothetical protein [Acidobacteriota bacterium]
MELIAEKLSTEQVRGAVGTQPGSQSPFSESLAETTIELGICLSGIRSYLSIGNEIYGGARGVKCAYTSDCRLVRSVLVEAARLNLNLQRRLSSPDNEISGWPSASDVGDFGIVLREAILFCDAQVRSGQISSSEWIVWSRAVSSFLSDHPVFVELINLSDRLSAAQLPARLNEPATWEKLPADLRVDLRVILSQFAVVLRSLQSISRRLQRDAPLKPTLLTFSSVYEKTRELIEHLDGRLVRFPDEKAEIFGLLDAASYTANLELKKVFSQELDDLISVRPALSVYSRVETASALLTE